MLQLDDDQGSATGSTDPRSAGWAAVIALDLHHIVMRRGTTLVLDDVSFAVADGERWLVLGANGSGKTSLLRVASMYEHPTSGTVEVLGERLGRTDVRELRRRVGYASAALADQLRASMRGARRRAHGPLRRARAVVAHLHGADDDAGRSTASSGWASPGSPSDRSSRCRRASASGCSSPGR